MMGASFYNYVINVFLKLVTNIVTNVLKDFRGGYFRNIQNLKGEGREFRNLKGEILQ